MTEQGYDYERMLREDSLDELKRNIANKKLLVDSSLLIDACSNRARRIALYIIRNRDKFSLSITEQSFEWQPIHFAVSNEDLELLNELVLSGAALDHWAWNEGDDPITPLGIAVERCSQRIPIDKVAEPEQIEIINLLIENGADPFFVGDDAEFYFSYTPLFRTTNFSLLQLLLESETKSLSNQKRKIQLSILNLAAREAIEEKLPNNLNLFLSYGADPNATDEEGSLIFLTLWHIVNSKQQSSASLTCLEHLLEAGAELDDTARTLKIPASIMSKIENSIGSTGTEKHSLHELVLAGNFEGIRKRIEAGEDIDARDRNGQTALTLAIREGNDELALWLLESGSIPEEGSPNTLSEAVGKGLKKIVEHLVANGADLFKPLEFTTANSILFMATKHKDMVKYLHEQGLPLDAKGHNGRSLLHTASALGIPETVSYLIEMGLDVNLIDENGKTAIDYCRTGDARSEDDRAETLRILRASGSKNAIDKV